MRVNVMLRRGWQALAVAVLAGLASTAAVTPARAQLGGGLPDFVWGYTLVPDPPLASGPTTLLLYGIYPTGCGQLQSATVDDAGNASIQLQSSSCVDTAGPGRWVATLPLGTLANGMHTVNISLRMDAAQYNGWVTFEVVGGQGPPPPPPPASQVLEWWVTEPNQPTPDRPMALIVGGRAPFGCPVVTSAAVLDTSHLTLTLAPSTPCSGDSSQTGWSHRFELGLQREGRHVMTVAILLAGETPDTVVAPVDFVVFHETQDPPPPDSLEAVLSSSTPNPFRRQTRFSVSIDAPEDADVAVFDVLGRRVSSVFRGRLRAGTTELGWNGYRDDGTRAVAGVYFYRLQMRGRVISRQLVLLRQQ